MDNDDIVQSVNEQPEDLEQQWRRLKCLVCGFLYEGAKRLTKCPKCGNEDMDKFEESE